GLPNIFQPGEAIVFGYFFLVVPVAFGYLAVTRVRVSSKDISRKERVRERERFLIKILTIHALLPLTMFFALCCSASVMLGFYHPELESLTFMMGMIPPVLNPVITVWFMKPYR
ncbi:hypothetical protein PFISCL1PPCAC_13470, partial [Pristionchus fissidentatus]